MKAIHKNGKVVELRGNGTISEEEIMESFANFGSSDFQEFAALCDNTEWSLSTIFDTITHNDLLEVSNQALEDYIADCLCDIKDGYMEDFIGEKLGRDHFADYLLKEGFYVEDMKRDMLWKIG